MALDKVPEGGNMRNPIKVALVKRYGKTSTIHKDKRLRRVNRKSWRKEYD